MGRLRILTLNIWNRQGPWEERLPLIRAGILRLDPDLVALQEIVDNQGHTQADDIRAGLPYEAAFGLAHDHGGGVGFGNAALSRWPIAKSRTIALPTGDSDERRSLLFCEIASPHGSIPFFVTHLNWKFHHGVIRERQVVAVADQIEALAPATGLPPILCGDFNAEPEAAEIRFLRGLQSLEGKSTFLADCFALAGEGPGFTYDGTRNPFAAPNNEYPRRIDYVFVRGPDDQARGKPLAARVVLEELYGGVAASDHYGMLAEVSI